MKKSRTIHLRFDRGLITYSQHSARCESAGVDESMLRDFPYIAFALIAACRAGVEFHKCALAPLSRLLRPLTRPSRETREQFGFGDIDTYVRRPSIQ